MKLKQLKSVMNKYGKAWEKQDIDLILDCFAYNGIYQESPLSKPYKGHREIRNFWKKIVIKNTREIHFKLGKCYISEDKKTGFAEWKCLNVYNNRKEKMVGIMIIKMKRDKITYLNEYWNTERN